MSFACSNASASELERHERHSRARSHSVAGMDYPDVLAGFTCVTVPRARHLRGGGRWREIGGGDLSHVLAQT
jgi:hypothetical protein